MSLIGVDGPQIVICLYMIGFKPNDLAVGCFSPFPVAFVIKKGAQVVAGLDIFGRQPHHWPQAGDGIFGPALVG